MRYNQSLPSNSFSYKKVPHLTEKRYTKDKTLQEFISVSTGATNTLRFVLISQNILAVNIYLPRESSFMTTIDVVNKRSQQPIFFSETVDFFEVMHFLVAEI
jgi:Ethanolamine utilization protein EutJ (predicted chaperonin)